MKNQLILTAASVGALSGCTQQENRPKDLNVIYILADDLGYGDLGCYGQTKIHTPNIDRLAAEGMLFTQHYAGCTVSAPSRSALMTGQHTLVLSRQNLPQLDGSSQEALKGGYILEDSTKDTPDAIIIATGSEVSLAVEAKKELAAENIDVRVVSMPCMDLFEDQPDEYKNAVLPKNVTARVGVEALSEFGWGKYIGINGEFVGMKSFGASAPGNQLFEHFGITKDAVVAAVKKTLN